MLAFQYRYGNASNFPAPGQAPLKPQHTGASPLFDCMRFDPVRFQTASGECCVTTGLVLQRNFWTETVLYSARRAEEIPIDAWSLICFDPTLSLLELPSVQVR